MVYRRTMDGIAMKSPLPNSISFLIFTAFSVLLSGALIFFRQRMFFVDPCFVAFEIINTHALVITEHRYGAFITQIVPLISSLLHFPLPLLLLLYSASFYIFYIGVCFLLIYKFRQYALALLMIFYFTLFVSDVYFWPNNEVHQGIAWMYLFFGLQFNNVSMRQTFWFHATSILTVFLAIFSHFIVMLPLTFLWIFFTMYYDRVKKEKKSFPIYSCILLTLMIIKYILGSKGWYDGEKLKGVTHLSPSSIVDAFSSGQLQTLGMLLLTNYWIVILVFVTGMWGVLREKKYALIFLTTGFVIGYLVLVSITFPSAFGREILFYMESQWMAMAIIVATPFVFYFLPVLREKQILGLVAAILLIRLIYIGFSFSQFNERFISLRDHVDALRGSGVTKVLIENTPELKEKYLMNWGLPVESLMFSAMEERAQPVTFKVIEPGEKDLISSDSFYSSFRIMKIAELNPYYFKLDTIQPYRITSFQDLKR